MSPSLFQPFDGLPGLCALARDEELRLVWCNEEYARYEGRDVSALIGSRPESVLSMPAAKDRIDRMRSVLARGGVVSFYQVWKGVRWHNRIWPLDPQAFGHGGVFAIMHKSVDPLPDATQSAGEDRPPVVLAPVSDLGELRVLTRRELEVFYWLATGMPINDIAAELFRSPKTIGRHAESIHRKLGYTNRAELVLDAAKRGLVGFTTEEWVGLVRAV